MFEGEIVIHTDGGSRGNPGPAACAFVVEDASGMLHKANKFLGRATNNHAEYSGVLIALNWLEKEKELQSRKIIFYLDSELIVRQINGAYKVKDANLQTLHKEIIKLIANLGLEVSFKNVPRERNKIADGLVNESLDKNT